MKVICVRWGMKYGDDYVTRLKSMVARHLKRAHEFICFTNSSVAGVTCEPLPSDLPTWWSKVGLFRLDLGETLYLDLDVVISRDFDLPELDDRLWTLDDFSYSLRTPKNVTDPALLRMLGGAGTVNSSVMWWRGASCRKVWDEFRSEVMDELHGDQNWITRCLWPDRIAFLPSDLACSFKYHVLRGESPRPITVFHGNPKVTELHGRHPLRLAWQ